MNNTSLIVFSKNRPMQLRAFLESFLHYTKFDSLKDIHVIYPHSELYNDLLDDFDIDWIDENKYSCFGEAYLETIRKSKDIILFGVDDFVYFRTTDLSHLNRLLIDKDVLSFSLRLGPNVKPDAFQFLNHYTVDNCYIKFQWIGGMSHYGYPFDVSHSAYNKNIVLEIFDGLKPEDIRIPNDVESIGVGYCMKHFKFKHPYVLMDANVSSGACVDINRVQDLYQNPVNGNDKTSSEVLNEEYRNGKRIDWKRYSDYRPDDCFIGTNNFQLI